MTLNARILLGLALGTLAGLVANAAFADSPALAWVITVIAEPAGQIFLRLLLMVVIPLVFSTLILGIAGLGDLGHLGRLGGRTLTYFLGTTLLAASLGLLVVNVLRPGAAISGDLRASLLDTFASQAESTVAQAGSDLGVSTFVNLVPANPLAAAVDGDLIAFIVFTLVFGVALLRVPIPHRQPVLDVLDGVARATMVMIDFAMRIAPYGVAGFAFAVTARLGGDVVAPLASYFIAVLVGLAFYQFGVLALFVRTMTRWSPRAFYGAIRAPMVAAFSTASSAATLPITLQAAEDELGVSRSVSGFVLPLGATLHMNGTAFFQAITIVFLAQAFGVPLSAGTQIMIVVLTVLTAVSAAGIPSGSIPLIVVILISIGVPGEAIALIFGVEPILGMARTSTNVTGDLAVALAIQKYEEDRGGAVALHQ